MLGSGCAGLWGQEARRRTLVPADPKVVVWVLPGKGTSPSEDCLCLEGILGLCFFFFPRRAVEESENSPSVVGASEFLPAQVSTENSPGTRKVTARWEMKGKVVALWGEHWSRSPSFLITRL